MLYLLYGDHGIKKQEALERVLQTHDSPGIFLVGKGEPYAALVDEHLSSASLFGGKSAVVFDDALADKDGRADLLARTPEMAESENLFIFIEQKALKEILTAFKDAKAKIEEYTAKEEKTYGAGAFNVFALTDAFARKDKKETWVLLEQALMSGKSPEELAGLIFWQIKSLLLVKDPRATATSLSMKPFVFSKASAAAKLWKDGELERAASMLISGVHQSRRGESDPAPALERLVLEAL